MKMRNAIFFSLNDFLINYTLITSEMMLFLTAAITNSLRDLKIGVLHLITCNKGFTAAASSKKENPF